MLVLLRQPTAGGEVNACARPLRQGELKGCATRGICPQPIGGAVDSNKRAAIRKSHTGAVRLVVKNALKIFPRAAMAAPRPYR